MSTTAPKLLSLQQPSICMREGASKMKGAAPRVEENQTVVSVKYEKIGVSLLLIQEDIAHECVTPRSHDSLVDVIT